MMPVDLSTVLKERIMILDGAMGTMLQARGMIPGQCPELFGVEHPEVLKDIHYQYVQAGVDIIETNTFGGNRFKLAEYGMEKRVDEINQEAVHIARQAAAGKALVAASIGPTGQLLRPMGRVGFDDLFEAYAEQIRACEKAGADLISIETMTDIGEMRAALIAARESTRLPVIAHMTFENGGRTMTGTDPLGALIILEAFQPLAVGANCSGGARELLPVIAKIGKHTSMYISVEPNAGLPSLVNGETVFPDSPEEMAENALRLRQAGANIIGGCCGSTPRHIQAMARALKGLAPVRRTGGALRALASRSRYVIMGPGEPLAFIGERINPTARKPLAQDIKEGKMILVAAEAKKQVASQAPILDVNMGVPGIDEAAAMTQAVMEIQSAVDVPLSLDSTNPQALEAGLKNFVGRALINSTTGEERTLQVILPLARKYGAAVLGLCLDEKGIPARAQQRVEIARRIVNRAKEYGLREQDIYVDCLVQTASAEQGQVMETLEAVRVVKNELNVGTVLGISNVSHGLPARSILNSNYLAMAWAAGLDLPIMNPFDQRMMDVYHALAVLLNKDPACRSYIECYRDTANAPSAGSGFGHPICRQCNIPQLLDSKGAAAPAKETKESPVPHNESPNDVLIQLQQAVLEGDKAGIENLVRQALERRQYSPLELINKGLIPGIEEAGVLYEEKKYFLPQLMMAAETMKSAFALIKPHLTGDSRANRGVIVLATVEGDIHDIGKNIVAILLENYGFRVVDLGKDVKASEIIDAARREKADLIGLSALMTTTMPRMQEAISLAREQGLTCRIMVGGAVLTQEYADMIGADAYSQDARQAVLMANKLVK
ncbi:MAG TPA: homocysteine S-methyltransferase family protein [Syntrophomonadaceae bacterium]|nr:homocysteine S-methyltransferase family protein [Syntrophomonadaceae bacterium]